jgi:hypothetical protein
MMPEADEIIGDFKRASLRCYAGFCVISKMMARSTRQVSRVLCKDMSRKTVAQDGMKSLLAMSLSRQNSNVGKFTNGCPYD